MAKVLFTPFREQIRGKIGDLVFRRSVRGMAVMREAQPTSAESSLARQQVRDRFQLAAAFASAVAVDPARVAHYAPLLVRTRSLRLAAMADCPKSPAVPSLEAGAFRGEVGYPILVRAVDDVAAVAVQVTLRDCAGAVLEQGAAMAAAVLWTYSATTGVGAGTKVMVEAVATDRPGNAGSRTVTVTLP